jgi:drug/metabolite transporter (DMT)-like permease
MDMFALHLAVLLFGAAALVAQATTLSPGALALGRCLVAAPVLLALAWRLRSRDAPWPSGIHVAASGLLLAVHWTAFFHAMRLGGVPTALLAYASFPAFVLLLDQAWPDPERPVPPLGRQLVQLGSLTAGLALLAGLPGETHRWEALGAGLVSGATFAALARGNAFLRRRHGALELTGLQLAVAAAFLALWHAPEMVRATPRDWALLAVLGLACTALGHGLFLHALKRVPPFQAGVAAGLEPVYGLLLAALLGQPVAGREWLALPLMAGAALLGLRRSRR